MMERMLRRRWFVAAWTAVGVFASASAAAEKVEFNRDVRPILSDNCFKCHGFDKNTRKADLRLDTKEGLFAVVKGVAPVVAGKPEDSEVYKRIVAEDEDELMPPRKSGKHLTAAQKDVIKRWIEQGAEFQGHWAYIAPKRSDLPRVEAKHPVDRFVLARLAREGLKPSPETDRVTLIRRLHWDLVGLPPTAAEVDAFVNDKAPDAYDRLVDRLLASPHYGERMAILWLDLVRYADSIGYHSDNPMNVWPYRDYVIKSFNENKRFDRFTIEQLAGDLLPDGTVEQKVASAYNRLLQTTEEGGAQPKEYTAKYAADRVRNLGSVWLGATLGCAECHDHKFDPYSAKDFYSLAAFFADVQEAAVGKREPGMPVPQPEHTAAIKAFDDRIAALKAKLDQDTPELRAAQVEWEKRQGAPIEWKTLEATTATVRGESKLKVEGDGIIRSIYKLGANETFLVTVKMPVKGVTGFRLEALDDDAFPQRGPGGSPNGNFVLTEFKVSLKNAAGVAANVKLAAARADYSQDGHDVSTAIDGKNDTGWAVLGQVGKPHFAVFQVAEPLRQDGEAEVTFTLDFRSRYPQHQIGKFRLSATSAAEPAARVLTPALETALKTPADQRTGQQKKELGSHFRAIAPILKPVRDELAAAQKERDDYVKNVPSVLVSIAGKPRTVRVLPRGNWLDDTGEVVEPSIPAALGSLGVTGRRATRLDLAKWIVSKENPVTSRVMVNRLFKQYFGHGISKSQEDLGSQGEWPVNPELLDYLAVEFVESGWDVKHMVRLLVTSDAYRQTSVAPRPLIEKDPENRLLARQSRFRIDAELVRDNALAVSGLLVNKIGGPSVKPYQPAGYWDFLNFPRRTWEHDKDAGQYRRGLYTHWQRSFLHPSLVAFDAPSREECTAERVRSNIPQQALALMNDPTYVEASRKLGERMVKDGGDSVEKRIGWAYRHVLSRQAKPPETQVLVALYEKHLKEYRADPGAAMELLGMGIAPASKEIDPAELAAWTSVARTILNLHETITRS